MFNIFYTGDTKDSCPSLFGEKYDLTDDVTQANVIAAGEGGLSEDMLESRLLFAVADLTESGLAQPVIDKCSSSGICVFRSDERDLTAQSVRDFIENGNITCSVNFADVSLGPFGSDVSRVSVLMNGIDAPVLFGAMMTSEMDVRAAAGGLKGGYGAALIALREPVMRLPHAEGVIKVRVLQDI